MKKKSLFAGFLALVMCVGSMSLSAFAAENVETIPDVQEKTIVVDSLEDLRWVSDYSNGKADTIDGIPVTFAGYTIQITNDISNVGNWTPLKDFNGNMIGVLKADNSTPVISDVVVSVEANAGLCGNSANGKFSNLTIANSSFKATGIGKDIGNNAGAFAGNGFTSSFENCHVINTTVVGNRFVGGITGYCYGNIKNCTVLGTNENALISAALNRNILHLNSGDNVGGIVGFMGEGSMTVSGCVVDGVTVKGSRQVAGIAGIALYGNTVKDNCVKNTTLHATWTNSGSFLNTTAAVGGILGQIQPNSTNIITIDNNTVENLKVTRGGNTMNYCGWLLGDITRGTNYTATGNTYIGTTTLPKVYGAN